MGRAIRALRGGGSAAESVGVDTAQAKLVVFVYAALLAGLSGWLYAHMQRAVSPSPFGLDAGIEYLLMAVFGGSGHVLGARGRRQPRHAAQGPVAEHAAEADRRAAAISRPSSSASCSSACCSRREGLWPLLRRFARTPAPQRSTVSAPPLPKRPACRKAGAPLLEAEKMQKQFGGLVAVNEVSFSVRGRRDRRTDRPQWRRQEHDLQPADRRRPPTSATSVFSASASTGCVARQIAGRGVARTFQHVKLAPQMSVLENVAIGAHLRGRAGAFRRCFRARPGARRRASSARPPARSNASGLAEDMHKPAGDARARPAARRRNRPRALPRSGAAAARRAGRRPAFRRKEALAGLLTKLRENGMTRAAGRARHGLRDEADRPPGRARFRPEDRRGRPRRPSAPIPPCSKPIWEASNERADPESRRRFASATARSRRSATSRSQCAAGAAVTVIGANGAGKTTLLNAIMGVLPSTRRRRLRRPALDGRSVEDAGARAA